MKKVLFYLMIAIALFGLVSNLDFFLLGIVRMIFTFALLAGIFYLIYYFFFLTPDQRKYKRTVRKNKRRRK